MQIVGLPFMGGGVIVCFRLSCPSHLVFLFSHNFYGNMASYQYQRILDEPYSDSEALGMPQSSLSKKKNIFPSHRRFSHEPIDGLGMNPMGAIPPAHDTADDLVYNTNDEFGEGNAASANNLKLVRTGRQVMPT